MNTSGTLASLKELLTRLIRLYVENAKLTLTEKLTMLLSAALFIIVSLVLAIFALAFFAGAALEALALVMEPWLCYLSLGGLFVMLIVMLCLLRKPLLVNPISRFISRLIFEASDQKSHTDRS